MGRAAAWLGHRTNGMGRLYGVALYDDGIERSHRHLLRRNDHPHGHEPLSLPRPVVVQAVMPMQSRTVWLLIIAMIAIGGLAALYFKSGADTAIDRDVEELKAATVPPQGRLVDSSPAARDDHSYRASWTIELPDSWPHYQAWLSEHPPLAFRPAMGATQPTFIRSLPGDSQSLSIEHMAVGRVLRITVTFRSFPD